MTSEERHAICEKFAQAALESDPQMNPLELSRLKEKLAGRVRMVEAFKKLDELRRELGTENSD
jgi:hypothetical protein